MNCEKKTDFSREKRVGIQEIKELAKERKSFILFANRIEQFYTENSTNNSQADMYVRHLKKEATPDAVKKAYEQTVMGIAHYDKIYNEGLRENMAHELGEDILTAIEQSSYFHPTLKWSIITAAVSAAERRSKFERKIKKEQIYIERFSAELCDICKDLNSINDQPVSQLGFDELRLTHEQLTLLFEQCGEIASERQQQIQSRNKNSLCIDNGDIECYLYSDCEHKYPILSTIAELCKSIQETIRTIEQLICMTPSEDVSSYPSNEQ